MYEENVHVHENVYEERKKKRYYTYYMYLYINYL